MSELLTVDELCLRWKCSRAYVYDAINRGALAAHKIAGWKVKADEAERFWLNNPDMPTDRSTAIEIDLGFPVRLVRECVPSGPVVYFVKTSGHDFVKIGFTANLAYRLCRLQTASPFELMLLLAYRADRTHKQELHGRFNKDRLRNSSEWFRYSREIREFVSAVSMVPQ